MERVILVRCLLVAAGAAVEAIVEAVAIAVLGHLHPGGTAVQRVPATAGARVGALRHQRGGSVAPLLMAAEALALNLRRSAGNAGKPSEKDPITARALGERIAGALRVRSGRDPQLVIGIEARRLMGAAPALEMMVMALTMSL